MFSGIVKDRGEVVGAVTSTLRIRAPLFAEVRAQIGDSVSVSGVCLTIREQLGSEAVFDLASETRRRTILGGLNSGSRVNLEPSLRLGEALHGHFVLGHVDEVGEVLAMVSEGENTQRLTITLPRAVSRYVVPKGSIAVDGVSLTVGEVDDRSFSVYLIPHTVAVTTLSELRVGQQVNLEADCIARYLEKLSACHFNREREGSPRDRAQRRRLLW